MKTQIQGRNTDIVTSTNEVPGGIDYTAIREIVNELFLSKTRGGTTRVKTLKLRSKIYGQTCSWIMILITIEPWRISSLICGGACFTKELLPSYLYLLILGIIDNPAKGGALKPEQFQFRNVSSASII